MKLACFIGALLLISSLDHATCDRPTAPSTDRKPLPGIDKLARGVDITKFDLLSVKHQTGLLSPLFEFTYKEGRVWPEGSKDGFKQPDQVAWVQNWVVPLLNVSSVANFDVDDLKQWFAGKVGLDSSFGQFSGGEDIKEVQQSLLQANRTVAYTTSTISSFQIQLDSRQNLSPAFRDFVEKRLTGKFDQMPEVYQEFINTFGTHYFSLSVVGGVLLAQSYISTAYMNRNGDAEVQRNLGGALASFVNVPEWHAKSMTQDFQFNSKHQFSLLGGYSSVNPRDSVFMASWVPTIVNNAWIHEGNLAGIESLISNSTIQREVEKAVRMHRLKAYFDELKRAVVLTQFALTNQERNQISSIEQKLKYDELRDVTDAVATLSPIFTRIQSVRDRERINGAIQDGLGFLDTVASCKYTQAMIDCVTSSKKNAAIQEKDEVYNMMDTMRSALSPYRRRSHQGWKQLLEAIAKMVGYHRNQAEDFCGDDTMCQACITVVSHRRFTPSDRICSDPILHKIIKWA